MTLINKVNDLIFDAKLKNIRLNEYHKIIGYSTIMIFLSQQLAYAHPSFSESNKAIEFLDNYGPPLILSAEDLLNQGIPILLHMKNLRITSN
jgi:hypothetical protein